MKNFAQTSDVNDPAFRYLSKKFLRLSFEMVKACLFIDIKQLFKEGQFKTALRGKKKKKKKAKEFYKNSLNDFLENFKARNFRELVEDPIQWYEQIGAI